MRAGTWNRRVSYRHSQIRKGGLPALFRFMLVVALLVLLQTNMISQSRPADLVVINANIRTIVSKDSRAEALAVSGNRITSVGTNKRIKNMIGPSTRVIDARGRLVLPGFNDAHVHFMGIGNRFSSIDLRNVNSANELMERISRYVRYLPKGRWLVGGGWIDTNWKLPDKKSLDAITPDNPVFLYHADGRSALANTLAFRLGNLREGAAGADRTSSGEATGIVKVGALDRIHVAIPANHTKNWLEIAETATNYAASLGVTSVQDMHSDDSRDIYRELQRLGKLKTRVYDCIPLPDWKNLAGVRESDDMVRGGCLKSFSDGEEDSAPRLLRDIPSADKAGLQVMIHAIGNSANDIVLDVFEQVTKLNGPRDRRFRIEHAHNPRLADVRRFKASGIIASMQPHLFNEGSGGFYSSLLKQQTRIAFGSDASITDLNPLLGIHAAVNAGDEAVSVYEAVRAYTIGSAYAEFQEKQKGTIEPGRLADFVILSDDIFTIDAAGVREIRVVVTVVDGRVVYGTN